MFPTLKQFRGWSYPSRFAFVTFFIAFPASVGFWLFPDAGKQLIASTFAPSIDRKLVGTWKGTTTTKSPAGELIATGFTRLLDTGQYNYTGEVELRAPEGASMLYSAVAAGSWKAVGDRLIFVASDIKSVPRVLKQPGKPDINLTDSLRIPPHLLPHIEDATPAGASQEYVIVDLTRARLRATSSDLRGVPVLYEAVRQ